MLRTGLGHKWLVQAGAAALLLAPTLPLGGCAAPTRYMGIDLTARNLPEELQHLARMAQLGDKQAQLDLGIAFEQGFGVPADRAKARSLYAQAASNSGGPVWVYVPSVVAGQPGRVMQVGTTPRRTGLREARLRLEALGD